MQTNPRNLLLLIWTGPVSIALVLLGWMALAGFLPPPAPSMAPAQFAEMWADHTNLKRLGMVVCVWGGVLYVPFTVAVGFVLRRVETGTPILSTAQAALGTFGTVFFSLNFLVLAAAAFRPELPAATNQPLTDLGFIMTFSPVAPFTFQYALIGLAILQQSAVHPVFPRWVGYLNLWVAVAFVPATAIPFFSTGILAWNGLLGFWIPVGVFVIWFAVMFWAMRRTVIGQVVARSS
ncbi:MAG: hypothetical protein HYZ38_25195 [Mycobacterium sp.]|nr:hypothetical protein [Mycobacterium sp.]